jgi:hypothetical protein
MVAHHDVIQFNGGVFADFADLLGHAVQSGTSTVITDAGVHTSTPANTLGTAVRLYPSPIREGV